MNRRIAAAPLVLIVALGAAQVACSDDELPVDILMIVAKAQAGMPPADEEQKRLEEYGLRHRDEPVNGVTFGDVLAIVHSAAVTHTRPPQSEIAKMRSWANGMKQRKAQLQKDATAMKHALERASGGKSTDVSGDTKKGFVTYEVNQLVTKTTHSEGAGTTSEGKEILRAEFEARYPVHYEVSETQDEVKVTWYPLDKDSVSGMFNLSVDLKSENTAKNGTTHETVTLQKVIPIATASKATDAASGTLVAATKAARPYLQASATCASCAKEGEEKHHRVDPEGPVEDWTTKAMIVPMPPEPITFDNFEPDGPFAIPAGVPPEYRQLVISKLPPRWSRRRSTRSARSTRPTSARSTTSRLPSKSP